MRATALIIAIGLCVCGLAPASGRAQVTAYASDNGGGPSGPNNIPLSIPVTATVGSQCSVLSAGSPPAGATFGATVALGGSGVIVDANGHLLGSLNASSSGAASVSQTFQVNCSGTADAVVVKATPVAANPVVAAPSGYANTVNYTAEVDLLTTGSPAAFSNTSDGANHNYALPTGVGLGNTAGDVTIKAYAFTTGANVATDILVASPTYQGAITVTISAGT